MTQPDMRPARDADQPGPRADPPAPRVGPPAPRVGPPAPRVGPPARVRRRGSSDRPPPSSTTAGKAIVVVVAGLVLAALLNSRAMVGATDNLPQGWRRTTVRTVAVPLDVVARALRLDRPRARVDSALGRDESTSVPVLDDPVVLPPVAGEGSKPTPAVEPSGGAGRTAEPGASILPVPAAPGNPRRVTAAEPLRLLIAGDSMIEFFGPALVNRIDDGGKVKARIDVKYGTGLVRLDAFDWLAHARDLGAPPGDATIVMMGGNDAQDMTGRDGRLGVATSQWQAEYARRAARVMTTLTSGNRRVFWIGMPLPRSPKMRRSFEMINGAIRAAAAANPLVTYVDIWTDYAPGGRYVDYMDDGSGRQVKIRNRDGIHLSKAGGLVLAGKMRGLLLREWSL